MAVYQSGLQTGMAWARESLSLFKANTHQWMLVAFVYVLIFWLLPSLPGMTILAVPVMVMWPAFVVFVMMLFRNQEAQRIEPVSVVLDKIKPKLKGVIVLGCVCFAYAVLATYVLNSDIQSVISLSQKNMSESETLQYFDKLMPLLLKLLLLLAPVFLVTWFAPMLIALNDYPLVKALKSSIAGVLQYTVALGVAWIVIFGMNMLLLVALGLVVGTIGLLVPALAQLLALVLVFSVFLLSTALMFAFQYVSYRDVFRAAPITLS